MTENEKKFVNKYLEYYKKYNGNIPYQVWTKEGLSDYRQSLGISLKRSSELTVEAVRTLNQNDNNMDENSVVKLFKRELGDWLGCSSDYDCATFQNHIKNGNMYIPQFRANFIIPQEEEILFTRDTSWGNDHNQGLVITDQGFYYLPDNDYPEDIRIIKWSDFDKVVYHNSDFYFYNGNQVIIRIFGDFFFKYDYDNKKICEKFARILMRIAELSESDYSAMIKFAENGEYDKAIDIANKLINLDTYDRIARYIKCGALYDKGTCEKNDKTILLDCIKESVSLIKILDDNDDDVCWLFYFVGSAYVKIGEYEKARDYLIQALLIDDVEKEREVQEMLDVAEDKLKNEWEQYTQKHSYLDRRLIMPIKDSCIAGCVCDEIKTFRISHLPSDFEFPSTIPVVNQLYIGHRYNPNVYIPFEQSEEYFFLDKVDELCNLLQCLGAKTITIKRVTGKDVGELYKGEFETKGNVGYKLAEAEAQYKKEKNINRENEKKDSYERCLTYDKPTKLPYIPDDLHWFHHIKKWQNIANERVQNGGKVGSSFHECISTSETRFYSSSELDSINAAVKILLVKASGSMNNKEEKEYKESTNTEWSVDVEFWALDEFDNGKASQKSQKKLTDNEEKYKEEVLFYLEDDGIIDDEERRFLERKRVRLGISEDRAKEIEEECMPQLTSEEKEYLEALKELGEVDLQNPRIRRMLDHERDDLGISEERALELEKQYCNQ